MKLYKAVIGDWLPNLCASGRLEIMSLIRIDLEESGDNSTAMSPEVSPDSKCPICLDMFSNVSYLDVCLHKFCFHCIREWSKNKAECPLCKQPFSSIYHSRNPGQDFKKYDLLPPDDNSFGTVGEVRFRYQTSLTGFYQQMRGRPSAPRDNGVMFESAANVPQQPRDQYIRHMMNRLAAKSRAASEGRAVSSVGEQEMINFRRELYRAGVRVRNVHDGGRARDISSEFLRRNPACLHRLVPWLKRELIVLYGEHGALVNIVQHLIMSRVTHFDMEDGTIQEELMPFLQGRTGHFFHEFISYAKSPFDMEAYDRHAVYECPSPSSNENNSSNSSVIFISEDEEDMMDIDPLRNPTSTMSYSVWDDEIPGPSYSTAGEQSSAGCLSVLDLDYDSSSDEEAQEFGAHPQPESSLHQTKVNEGTAEFLSCKSNDCVVVGYVKPTAERTPEVIVISSDSGESASEDPTEMPLLRQHIRFQCLSPIVSQNSNLSDAGRSEDSEANHDHLLDSRERNGFSTSSKHKNGNRSDKRDTRRRFDSQDGSQERSYSKDRKHRRRRRSRSEERRYSRINSHSSAEILSRERGYSHSSGRGLSKGDSSYDSRNGGHSSRSYRHYSQDRLWSRMHYTDKHPGYHGRRRYSRQHSYSRSRSRSRESWRRERKHSRSRSCSSSRSPSTKKRFHYDKPGGKRKYKTKHLEKSSEVLPNSEAEDDSPTSLTKHKKTSNNRHHKKSKDRSRRTSRSASLELVNESSDRSRRQHKKKKKHKKKSKRHKSSGHREKSSSSFIIIDSDSDCSLNDRINQENSFDNPPTPSIMPQMTL
ncbi:topoisomerase I binding, arginine/serine-rich a [Antennarius striatus]|uniref:topoisomerase I binding, arginine/serine-rich a n=1 Tax=Antennarius striatus TaxID=241820 RepID=UPI0035B32C98